MSPNFSSPESDRARLKDDLCRGTGSAQQDLAHLVTSYPMTSTAVALLAGVIVGLRPGLLRGALTAGGWLLKRRLLRSLSAIK